MIKIFFAQLELSDASLQMLVEGECLKLLTINKHKELYKFNLFSFEIKVALSTFQQIMDTMLIGLDCTQAYLDDILIKNETRHQHAEDVKIVFERIKEYGF